MEVGTLNTMFKAYAPAEMAERIAAYGIRKVQLDMAFNGRGYAVEDLTPEFCGEVRQAFADAGIQIRSYADEGFRITVGTEEENALVLSVLKTYRRNA